MRIQFDEQRSHESAIRQLSQKFAVDIEAVKPVYDELLKEYDDRPIREMIPTLIIAKVERILRRQTQQAA